MDLLTILTFQKDDLVLRLGVDILVGILVVHLLIIVLLVLLHVLHFTLVLTLTHLGVTGDVGGEQEIGDGVCLLKI